MARSTTVWVGESTGDQSLERFERCQSFHVIRTLEGRRLDDILLTHASYHLFDRTVLVLFHPTLHVSENLTNARNPVLQELRSHHGHLSAGHQSLERILIGVHSGCNC